VPGALTGPIGGELVADLHTALPAVEPVLKDILLAELVVCVETKSNAKTLQLVIPERVISLSFRQC
jgi:hypothetical protein